MKQLSLAAVILAFGAAAGCMKFGAVEQGWVVEYRAAEGMITLIPEGAPVAPLTIQVPEDPREMGPAPAAGNLVGVDLSERQLTVFDPASRTLKKVAFTPIAQTDNVRRDDPRVAAKRLPAIDPERRTVTLYVPRGRRLLTIEVAAESLALPADAWKFGDEIRYYYKDPGRALRLMNVTRTDINKAGE